MFGIFWWPLTDYHWRFLMPSNEVLTIHDVASLLKVGEKTAYTMAQSGDLPGFKVRGQWRFLRSDLDAWIREQVEQAKTARDDEGRDK